jgi:2-polyprenyl-3-methyl-5-hydroxy-6-metoxy-1,4-benzoquinol methylase
MHKLSKEGYDNIWGVDIRPDAIESGKKLYKNMAERLIHYDGHILPFDRNRFDVVTMFDDIEHLPAVSAFLLEVHRIFKTGGIFIFQTPNKIINIPWMIIEQKRIIPRLTHHCSLQTAGSLRRNLLQSGFVGVHIEKYTICTEYNLKKVEI